MRKNGTRYRVIETLPAKALPVSQYACETGYQIGSVYMSFKRFKEGYVTAKGTKTHGNDPGYEIRCYKGMNFVIKKP